VSGVPHLDLVRQHAPLREDIVELLSEQISRAAFVGGPAVAAFETAFAEACGASHCVGVANGTEAIKLALRACGVGAGDEVLLPAFTFVATAGAVLDLGARPVLVDVEAASALLDPALVAERCSEATKALLPVHLYGMPCDVPALRRAAGPGKAIIEDSAQAHSARLGDQVAGSMGDAASFSFYPTKNLSAMGDGGAVTSSSREIADAVRVIADHGRPLDPAYRDDHLEPGVNSRLDALQASVLSLKLERLPAWQARRRAIAARYREALAGREDVRLQEGPAGAESAWHLFVMRHADRDALMAALQERGVQSRAVYPRALHQYGALKHLGHGPGDFPHAEGWAAEVLTLPMFPELSDEEVTRVVEAAVAALDELARAGG
jgi:dTDP-4-amino-4,6-dideoxygalactose transaminase